ncbi:Aldo-ket-red domain-containing protein [Mycena indigotica]|uniref:Aldo-ket-red domain-containing protein n=1 Tax=Mycena indigotica TaxID=2126181 RepID=A0A8H6WBF2_9AGAR|nr:Aldo-ket-red domain-containing protein [Mycena indigotica]KAF7310171.1 Aldo-ket-red domain-containing protein [Mycena indigotica]
MPFDDIVLNDGRKIPSIAFGTGSVYKRMDVTTYVKQALDAGAEPTSLFFYTVLTDALAGFSHIDTAQGAPILIFSFPISYDHPQDTKPKVLPSQYQQPTLTRLPIGFVGAAIRDTGLARSEFYVTTKYSRSAFSVDQSINNSLSQLGLKFVDLYLIHQPSLSADITATWKELEAVQKAGLAKSIGVSNFPLNHLKQLCSDPSVTILPAVNQIQLHPYNYHRQRELIEWAQAQGIVIEAYGGLNSLTQSPGGPVDTPVAAAAARLCISPTQVLLGWLRAKGVVIVTTTSHEGRLAEYLAAGDLRPLPPADVAAIDAAGAQGYRIPRILRSTISLNGPHSKQAAYAFTLISIVLVATGLGVLMYLRLSGMRFPWDEREAGDVFSFGMATLAREEDFGVGCN